MTVERIEGEDLRVTLADAIASRRRRRVRLLLQHASPDEAVEVLCDLPADELAIAIALLGDDQAADLLENVAPSDAAQLLRKLSYARAADILEEMDPDDATDLVEELEPEEAEAVLIEMATEEADEIRELMAYPPHSAAGRMTKDVVTVSLDLTADEALAAIRRLAATAETIYYVYVTDDDDHLLGVLNLRDLVLAPPATPIERVTTRDPIKVLADDDQEAAARVLAERGLLAVPVVDAENRLLGIVTADDVADILEQEATEDIERLGGSQPLEAPYLRTSAATLVRKRLVWLLVLFVGGALTSNVLDHFEQTLAQVVALMFFVPLLVGIGGNVGSQIVTTLVRAMAVGEVQLDDVVGVLAKELGAALVVGAVMAAVAYLRAWTLDVDPTIGLVVAVTSGLIVLWAATVGAVLPLVIRRIGADPAVVSTPLISTLVDATGLFLYLTVARALLGI